MLVVSSPSIPDSRLNPGATAGDPTPADMNPLPTMPGICSSIIFQRGTFGEAAL
jgi:hypothetical protein